MKKLVIIFFIGIIIVVSSSLFMFDFGSEKSISDLKRQTEFLESKHEYEQAANLFDAILKIDPDDDLALNGKKQADQIMQTNPTYSDSLLSHTNTIDKSILSLPILSKSDQTLKSNSLVVPNDQIVSEDSPVQIKSAVTDEILEADRLYDEQKYAQALSLYNFVLADGFLNLHALNGKANSQLALQQFDESIATFETVLVLYPDNIDALNGKSYALYLKALNMSHPGFLYDSVHGYEKTLQVDPENFNALVGIASSLSALERYDEATEYYLNALSLDPDHINVKNGLFSLWIKLGNNEARSFYFDNAIDYFDKVLKIDPDNLEALLAKASSYAEWGKSEEKYFSHSEMTYSEILELHPNNTKALSGMGYVLSEQLEFEHALFYYEKALEIDPENVNAKSGKNFTSKRIT